MPWPQLIMNYMNDLTEDTKCNFPNFVDDSKIDGILKRKVDGRGFKGCEHAVQMGKSMANGIQHGKM